jgi:HlyD family secretion protein
MTPSTPVEREDIAKALGMGKRSRWRKSVFWLVLLTLGALAVSAWLLVGKVEQGRSARFRTEPATRGDLVVTVTATGTLEPTNKVDVGSELSGIVRSVEVDYNDAVAVGQPLARLDTAKLQAQVQRARATLESAQARVLQARATVKETRAELSRLKKIAELSGGTLPSQAELDAAEAKMDRALADEAAARAAVSEAGANVESDETDLAKAVIVSPIDGMVLSRAVEPGQTVAASLQAPVLFTLAEDLSRMELHVDVDEADVGQVREGQEAHFTVDAYPERSFPAAITQVRYGAKTVDGVVTYETLLQVDNTDLTLRPGMTATADIVASKIEGALLVPNAALRFVPPRPEQGTATRRGGSLLSQLVPRPPRGPKKSLPDEAGARSSGRVWTLREGVPTAVQVTLGASDGIHTAIIAADPPIAPGTELLVDTLKAAN